MDDDDAATIADDDMMRQDAWPNLGAVEAVMLLGAGGMRHAAGSQTTVITVDSGAAEVVAPPNFASGYRRGRRHGHSMGRDTASSVANQGEKGHVRMMTVSIVDMTEPVASAGRITAEDTVSCLTTKASSTNIADIGGMAQAWGMSS